MYISENCQWIPYGTNPELDKQVDCDDWNVRKAVAQQGYGLDKLINDKRWEVRREVAIHGYGLDKLVSDESWWVRRRVELYLKANNLNLKQWRKQNPDKCVLEHNQLEEVTKDFIYKIDESNKLDVQTQYDSIDEFFNSGVEDDIKMNTLVVCSVDTKIPLFEIEKVQIEIIEYKFIVDITNEQGDDFRVRTVIQSREQLDKLIQQTIDALNLYPQFSNYADELKNCL